MAGVKERLSSVLGHLNPTTPSNSRAALLQKNPDDIVITFAARTPLTKAKKGGLKDTRIDELVISLLTEVRQRSKIDPSVVEDVCLGNVLADGSAYIARSSVLAAGFPVTTAASVANRFCSSGLLAIQQIANQIATGCIDVGIAIGAESMIGLSTKITEHEFAGQNLQPMGQTSENVAGDFSITREKMDKFAAESYQKAEISQKAGWSSDEILPTTVLWKDPKTGEVTTKILTQDDGPRHGTTAESLSKIRAAFPQWPPSQTTGGNASQLTDGAAAILLMKRSKAEELGQPIIGKYAGSTVVGLEPRIMGIGPYYAIPKILEKKGLAIADVDVFEINEAFASMGVFCVERLGLDRDKVNPRGGAIALGHPLGCTGARQVVTALSELRRRDQRIAVTSMCVGTGMGMAGVFVSEH
ncbi:putative 3-ketoacyl-CoA thiolase B, peroxisomal [Glarea lozoyensis 74030]|uniref:acetyl-CoA C-acyltransferase n=1 Tax=Glarea lozoyensis (strain ATCC 74030 / MF5533) TaxID=1104152 RepID=H0EG07_GLAL7|nr:putative 3-ketoacyl-CoA thiolase B, peroxisomal [Glarea lozoyensis 74030]